MIPQLNLTREQADALTDIADIGNLQNFYLVKRENDLYLLKTSSGFYYLKVYTKSWYGDNLVNTSYCVEHEVAAYQILQSKGLNTPEIVSTSSGLDNPLFRPFLLTRALPGKSLLDLLEHSGPSKFYLLLEEAGAYLSKMHEISFSHPGYLNSLEGPSVEPDPTHWQHPIWSAQQAQKLALEMLQKEKKNLSAQLVDELEKAFSSAEPLLRSAHTLPRFVHGDCHVGQFFIQEENVTGVVDMEVASAGNPEYDLVKFSLEMMSFFPMITSWWEPLFKGYGIEPDFERFRLMLLMAGETSFTCHQKWFHSYESTLWHLLSARDWKTLFSRPSS